MERGDQERLRFILHELSNLLTGMLVSGGLLKQALANDGRERYAQEICNGGERSAALVREGRRLLSAPEERLPEAMHS